MVTDTKRLRRIPKRYSDFLLTSATARHSEKVSGAAEKTPDAVDIGSGGSDLDHSSEGVSAVDVVSRAGVVSADPTLVSTEHPDHSSEGVSAVDVVSRAGAVSADPTLLSA